MLYLDWLPVPPTARGAAGRTQSRTAYALLEAMLRRVGLPVAPIRKTPQGRPYLRDLPLVDFSIAHTDTLAVCALAVGTENAPLRVGVDAESLTLPAERARRLAMRFFAPEEQRHVSAADADAAFVRAFLEVFTRKEALAKYRGTGLSETILVDTMAPGFCEAERIRFSQQIEENHLITLCLPANAPPCIHHHADQ